MNQGIIEALKNINHDLRLVNFNRWLAWNDYAEDWEVYESNNRGGIGKLVESFTDEAEAVRVLLETDDKEVAG